MLVVNFLVATASIWLIIYINHKFLQPALKNRQRFKLYKLRDELSLLAMSDLLDEKSEEYLILIYLTNSAIKATESFQVTNYLRFVFTFHKDKELKKRIDSVLEKIEQSDSKEYCRIASSIFQVMHEMLYSDTRSLRYFFFPLFLLIAGVLSLVRISSPKQQIQRKQRVIAKMDEDLDGCSHRFGQVCAT